ncbi:AraC-like ligand binding domain protein [Synechococcus sp. PCC 7335]|uniref:helix-turn-helix transcriptional regulator n=1 Tax=Synechococcus sp. (strain ATCC 29403 / PCC 7335) TaxID=91464 RepID=UPI00017ECEB3|nr:AraC family transcriptional regulator [Synechococcus sp. PCC 7335]EDX83819.1 AraC-like ligand binding domain protein [Synechococcus sp. PCC 7335]
MRRVAKPKEQVKFWRDPVLRDLEMLRATYIDYSFSRHAHEGFGIAIVESGAMAFEYRGAIHTAPAGSIVITHPGEMHTGQAALATGWTYRTLLPAVDWFWQAASELRERQISSLPYFASPVIHDRLLNRQLVALHRVLEDSPSALERESRFLWGLSQLIRGYASDRPVVKAIGKEHQAVQVIRDYLSACYANNVSLGELSAQVGLKPLRLLRSFKAEVGLPPHAYLTQVRVYQAKRLLVAGRSIAETAVETGFVDQSHLHRHFKKIVGVTPGQYIQGCKNVQD